MQSKHIINYRFSSLVIGLLLIAGSLFARQAEQHHPPKLPDPEQIVEMVDEMEETLSLTEKQKSSVSDLYFSHFKEVKELMKAYESDRENHRQAIETLRDEFEAQVKEILTDEQITEFEDFLEKRMEQHRKNRPNHK